MTSLPNRERDEAPLFARWGGSLDAALSTRARGRGRAAPFPGVGVSQCATARIAPEQAQKTCVRFCLSLGEPSRASNLEARSRRGRVFRVARLENQARERTLVSWDVAPEAESERVLELEAAARGRQARVALGVEREHRVPAAFPSLLASPKRGFVSSILTRESVLLQKPRDTRE